MGNNDELNEWNLSQETIDKFGLINESSNIGESFIHAARVFSIPDFEGAFLMECDTHGKPRKNGDLSILYKRKIKFQSIPFEFKNGFVFVVTKGFLQDASKEGFIKFLKDEISRIN